MDDQRKPDYVIAKVNRLSEDMGVFEQFYPADRTAYVAVNSSSRYAEVTAFIDISRNENTKGWFVFKIQKLCENPRMTVTPMPFLYKARIVEEESHQILLKEVLAEVPRPTGSHSIANITEYPKEGDFLSLEVLVETAKNAGLDAEKVLNWARPYMVRKGFYGDLIVKYMTQNNRFDPLRLTRRIQREFPTVDFRTEGLNDIAWTAGFDGNKFVKYAERRILQLNGLSFIPTAMHTEEFLSSILVPYIYQEERVLASPHDTTRENTPYMKREVARISLPPRPSAAPTIRLPQSMQPPKSVE